MRRGSALGAAAAAAVLLTMACSDEDSGSDDDDDGDVHGDLHQRCVDKINELRATLGRPAYGRWSAIESCVDQQATDDMASGDPHGTFGACGESSQNECPGWGWQSVEACLESMWGERTQENCAGCDACADGSACVNCDFYGPPACGHYVNMSALYYSEAACGFSETESGGWITIDFH